MKELRKMVSVTKHIKEVYNDLTARQLEILLNIALEEGQTQGFYARKCGESGVLVNRAVERFTKLDIIKFGIAPDGRSKAVLLNAKGKKLVEGIVGAIKED